MNEESMAKLHVRLLGEGKDCSRPTNAIRTGNEYQVEGIVGDMIVASRLEIRRGRLLLHLARAINFLVLAVVKRVPSEWPMAGSDYGFAAFFWSSSRKACMRAACSGERTSAGKSLTS
jgi:hypothetical protein